MLYLKQTLYSFKMVDEKLVREQIDEFNKIVDDLENIEVTLDNDDKALMLLNSISRSYKHFKDAMIYGREQTMFHEEVVSAVKANELQKKLESKA